MITKLPSAPWLFRNGKLLIRVSPVVNPNALYNLSKLKEGFTFAFNSLVQGLGSHDYGFLEQFLEPRLYKHTASLLKSLEEGGYSMKGLDIGSPEVSVYNLCINTGVEIDRFKNAYKEDYMAIMSINETKKMVNTEYLAQSLKNSGINPDYILDADFKDSWVYSRLEGPSNVLMSFDVVFKVDSPLTLCKDGNDLFDKKIKELHMLRFESCPVHFGTQKNMSHKSSSMLMSIMQDKAHEMFQGKWTVTDIDHILKGNPLVISKYALK